MQRSEVELVKQLLSQRLDPANETIEQRFKDIEKQISKLEKLIQGLSKEEPKKKEK